MAREILLIDGDQYLHRACAATERETKWDEENHILLSNETEALDTVNQSLKKITDHFGHTDLVLCFSGYEQPNFRLKVDPTYKASRVDVRKPMCFWDVRRTLMDTYKSVVFPGLEADDVMGILATKPGRDDKIIVSRDKDMHTIPGKLWDGAKFYNVTEDEADYFHMYQTLTGDASDGYKGCPGIGPKKAEKILEPDMQEGKGFWHYVVEAYVKAGLTEADALVQARLARILRWSDWDSKKKEPILWQPTRA